MRKAEDDAKDQILEHARRTAQLAYSPYSEFRVGAAVRADGKVYVGCNVENASYGLSVCAERVALFSAVADGARRVDALVVSTPDAAADAPAALRMPCGACRQVMAEFMDEQDTVVVDGDGKFTVESLMETPFRLKHT